MVVSRRIESGVKRGGGVAGNMASVGIRGEASVHFVAEISYKLKTLENWKATSGNLSRRKIR